METLQVNPPASKTAEFRMYDEFRRSLTLGIGELEVEKLDLLEWAQTHRANLTPDRRFDLVTHHYLKELYETHEQHTRVIYKSSQMGASEYGISYALHACDSRNATVLYVFPTDAHVSDFSSARIGPAIEASDYLMRIVVDWRTTEGKRGADRVTLKRIRNRFLYLRGSRVKTDGGAPQLKSIDADVLVLDEIDEMDSRAPYIAEKRVGHSSIAEQLWISTPTYAGFGIHAKWLTSDQREWFIRCPHCKKKQVLTINNIVTGWDDLDRPIQWHGWPDTAWVACTKCHKQMDRLAAGEWVATYPRANDTVGWHLSKLFSPMADLYSIVKSLETTDETARKEIYNQDLGLPYAPRGGKMSFEVLDKCQRDYAHTPIPGERTFMGVDVGKVLHVVIRGQPDLETGERQQRYAGVVDSFQALGNLINQYNVRVCVIDALPETRSARDFQLAYPTRVWLAYYVGQKIGSRKAEPLQWNENDGIVTIDRTRAIDTMYAGLYDQSRTIPAFAKDIPDYYDQMVAPVRVVENNVAYYINSTADHYAHAETYCAAAGEGHYVEPAGETINVDLEAYMTPRPKSRATSNQRSRRRR